jgi:hypothetical protein
MPRDEAIEASSGGGSPAQGSPASSDTNNEEPESNEKPTFNEEPKSKEKYPLIRRYKYDPSAVVDKLMSDMESFIESFEELVSVMDGALGLVIDVDPVIKKIGDLMTKTKIFDIEAVRSSNSDEQYRFLASGEWSDAFEKEVFPNGMEKAEISCKDAYITSGTLKFFKEGKFQKELSNLRNRMMACLPKGTRLLQKLEKGLINNANDKYDQDQSLADKQHKMKNGNRMKDSTYKNKSNQFKNEHESGISMIKMMAKYSQAIFSSALPLAQCVWGKIYSISGEMIGVNRQIEALAAKIS